MAAAGLDPRTVEELRLLAARSKVAGREMMVVMRRNVRTATLPARPTVRASALARLPRGGGLNQWAADSSVTTRILTGPRTAGVLIRVGQRGHDIKDLDAGRLRHPVFGQWRKGVPTQQVAPGFATKPLTELRPLVRAGAAAAISEAARLAGYH